MRSGYLLSERGDYQRAIEAADALRARPEAGQPEWRAPVAWATLNKGLALYELRRNPEAIAAYDEVIAFADGLERARRGRLARVRALPQGPLPHEVGTAGRGRRGLRRADHALRARPVPGGRLLREARRRPPAAADQGRSARATGGEVVEEPPLGSRAGERPEADALAVEREQVGEAMHRRAAGRCGAGAQLTRCCVAS